MPTLTTDRLVLREFVETDESAVHAYYAGDSEVVRHLTWGPNTEEDTRNFLLETLAHQRQAARRCYDFAVVLKSTGQLVGGCDLVLSGPESREAYIGYVLGRAFWGQGYATEAARALLAFGFDALDLHRITATCDPMNIASARVLEKIGMRREGHLREHMWARDHWRDSFLYAILDHEWQDRGAE